MVTDSSADTDEWWEQSGTKRLQEQADNTQTQTANGQAEVSQDTNRERTNSYQFYFFLQMAIERKRFLFRQRRSNKST